MWNFRSDMVPFCSLDIEIQKKSWPIHIGRWWEPDLLYHPSKWLGVQQVLGDILSQIGNGLPVGEVQSHSPVVFGNLSQL